MARKRPENKKWRSRPSRKKLANRNRKPCKVRKNNTKASNPKKPSQRRTKVNHRIKTSSVPLISLETNLTEEIFDTRVIHNFLTERYNEVIYNQAISYRNSITDIYLKYDKRGALASAVPVNIHNVICDQQRNNTKNIMIAVSVRYFVRFVMNLLQKIIYLFVHMLVLKT